MRIVYQGKVTDRTTGHCALTLPHRSKAAVEAAAQRLAERRGIERQDVEIVKLGELPPEGGAV